MEVDGGAWTSLCGSGTSNSSVGMASHESRLTRLLAGAPILEARRLGGAVEQPWRAGSVVEAGGVVECEVGKACNAVEVE